MRYFYRETHDCLVSRPFGTSNYAKLAEQGFPIENKKIFLLSGTAARLMPAESTTTAKLVLYSAPWWGDSVRVP